MPARDVARAVVLGIMLTAAIAGALPSGCSVPDLDERGKQCTGAICPLSGLPCVGGTCGGAPADGGCAVTVGLPACGPDGGPPIPRFVGAQTVDGRGDEFCNLPAIAFDVAKGALRQPPDGGAGVDTQATIQIGWSEIGVHIFVHVAQATIRPPLGSAELFNGDTFQAFVVATGSPTGPYGPDADPGMQVLVGAPQTVGTTGPCEADYVGSSPLCQGFAASLLVDGGYNAEFQFPWTALGATAVPSAGDRIGMDFSCDIQGPDGGALLQSGLWASPIELNTSVCSSHYHLSYLETFCDDRQWCIYPLGDK